MAVHDTVCKCKKRDVANDFGTDLSRMVWSFQHLEALQADEGLREAAAELVRREREDTEVGARAEPPGYGAVEEVAV